jgi:hypothetical protein
VIYEPDPGLLRSVLEFGPLDLGDIAIVHGSADLTEVWRDFATRPADVRLIDTPGYAAAYPDELRKLNELIPSLLQRTATSRATYQHRGKFWVRDIIDNVELLTDAPHFLNLAGCYEGVPAFIIGAGPSLDINVHQLNEAATKGIVFATNSGAVALAKHGIEPQVVVCIESIDASSKLGPLPFMSRCVRAFSLAAAPQTLRTGQGPLLPIHEAVVQYTGLVEDLTGCPGLSMACSVSTVAMSLARALGCSPVVLVGQDLAYSAGRTYATGTGYEGSVARVCETTGVVHLDWNDETQRVHGQEQGACLDHEPLRRIPAWGGKGEVDSGLTFAGVHKWFEETAELMVSAGYTTALINATEGGASIGGFEERTLADVLASLPEHLITPEAIAEQARQRAPRISALRIRQWLQGHALGALEVRTLARRVRRLAQHAQHVTLAGTPAGVTAAYARLELAEAALRRAIPTCPLVDAWSYSAVDEAMRGEDKPRDPALLDSKEAARSAIASGARVASAVERSALSLHEALVRAAARIQVAGTNPGTED